MWVKSEKSAMPLPQYLELELNQILILVMNYKGDNANLNFGFCKSNIYQPIYKFHNTWSLILCMLVSYPA